jgi:Acetyl-coenzyme A synthetase N-terminus
MVNEGELLWTPSAERVNKSHVTAFVRWLARERGLAFTGYAELWRWSVDDLEAFWQAIWDYFGVQSSAPYERVLADRRMPGAKWFPGARLNYAQHALRNERPNTTALMYLSERVSTAEIYRSLATLPEIDDSLIVNLDLPHGKFFMPLFVKLREGLTLDEGVSERIRSTLRGEYSPRHVPDKIYQVTSIPFTLTGKKMEVPVRKILMGVAPGKAANRDAAANPHALDYFVEYARTQKDYALS